MQQMVGSSGIFCTKYKIEQKSYNSSQIALIFHVVFNF